MVDQLLQVAEGDEKDQIDVIYAEYEATFAAGELLGAPGGEEGVEEHAAVWGELFGEGDEGAVGALGALGALARVALEGAGEGSTQEGEEEDTPWEHPVGTPFGGWGPGTMLSLPRPLHPGTFAPRPHPYILLYMVLTGRCRVQRVQRSFCLIILKHMALCTRVQWGA